MHNKNLINIVKKFYDNNNFSIRKVSEIFNIPKSTVHRWLHCDANSSNKKHRTNKNAQNIYNYKILISDELKKYPFCRAVDLQKKIHNKFGLKISISSIYIYVHQLGFRFKKVPKRNFTNKNLLLEKRQKFKNKIKNIKYKDVICIDESYFYSNSINEYGWLNKNSETLVHTKANPIKYTLLMAISCYKIVSYEIFKNTNADQNLFCSFLKNKVFPLCSHKYILMDNAKFHKTKLINDLFNNSNNKQLFIPPYSPQFNPIENVFGVIKNKYKYLNNNNNNCENNRDNNVMCNIILNFNYDLRYFYDHAFFYSKKENNIFI